MTEVHLTKEEIITGMKDIITGSELSALVSEQSEMFSMIAANLKIMKDNLEEIFNGRIDN